MRCGFPPFTPIAQMSYSPSAFESKAMRLPSGDQRGVVTSAPPKEVNCAAFEPSASQTQISGLPERADSNAILLPSGEKYGEWSPRVEEMKGVAVVCGFCKVPVPALRGAGMRQMLRLKKICS